MSDLFLTSHNKRKRWCLHAANMEYTIISGITTDDRIGTREIHSDEPVCLAAGKCTIPQSGIILVVTQIAECLDDTLCVQRIQQNSLHRFLVAKMLENFIDQQLSLTIRITGIDDVVRLFDKLFDNLVLFCSLFFDVQLPLLRDDGQIVHHPFLIPFIILTRIALLQDMTKTPCHDVLSTAAFNAAIFRNTFPKVFGNSATKTRFFCDK